MRYILFGFDKPYIALPGRAVVVVDLGRQFDEGKSPGKIGHGQSFQFVEVAAYRDDIRIANHVFRSADTDVCLLVPVIIVGYIQLEGKGKVTDRTDMPLVSREIYELQTVSGLDADDPYRQVFTLYYTALSDERTEVRFVVVDNFGRERELEVSFDSERQ